MSDNDRTEYKKQFNKEHYERVYIYMYPETKEKWIEAWKKWKEEQIAQGITNKKDTQLASFIKKIVNDYLGIVEEKPPRKKRRTKKDMESEKNGEMHPVDDPDDETELGIEAESVEETGSAETEDNTADNQ